MAFFADNLSALLVDHSFDGVTGERKPSSLFYCAQKHGAAVIEVDEQEPGVIAGDAMFTRTTRPIGILTADCLPILIGSKTDDFVAAIHGGWQGLMAGVVENSFSAFRIEGISLNNLQVAIGPAIQSCCCEFEWALIDKIEQVHGHLWRGRQVPWSSERTQPKLASNLRCAPATHGEAWFDLTLYCLYLLEASGLDRAQIQTAEVCTYCAGQDLGSYRRRTHGAKEKTYQYSWICRTVPDV